MYSVSRYSIRGNARYAFGPPLLGDIASWVGVGEDGGEEYIVVCVVARHHVARAAHTLAEGWRVTSESQPLSSLLSPLSSPSVFLLRHNRLWYEI